MLELSVSCPRDAAPQTAISTPELRHRTQHSLLAPHRYLCDIYDICDIGAVQICSCKSAKDRSSMFVTLEAAMLNGVGSENVNHVAAQLRSQGVRLTNCEQNVGKAMYAFNCIQKCFLPKVLRPPSHVHGVNCCCNGVRS